ncbi:MAG: hypothetical protein Q9213_000607 [Squamulea squamosa]
MIAEDGNIITEDYQHASAELEAVLLTHLKVISAAVIGIPLRDGSGVVPQAFVVLKSRPLDGTCASRGELEVPETTEKELKTYMASRLAKHKALNGVIFVDEIPRTASGKLQKVKLKELYASLSKTLKRRNDAIETADGPNDASGIRRIVSNRTAEVVFDGYAQPHRDGDR